MTNRFVKRDYSPAPGLAVQELIDDREFGWKSSESSVTAHLYTNRDKFVHAKAETIRSSVTLVFEVGGHWAQAALIRTSENCCGRHSISSAGDGLESGGFALLFR
jgi:hypothetical protein